MVLLYLCAFASLCEIIPLSTSQVLQIEISMIVFCILPFLHQLDIPCWILDIRFLPINSSEDPRIITSVQV